MKEKALFTVSEFARFSRTTKDTLRYYEKIGLLTPFHRGTNKYRYYSSQQLSFINVIRTLQNLGMSLLEITSFMRERTIDMTQELFESQIDLINDKIDEWVRAKKLLLTYKQIMKSVSEINADKISIAHYPAEAIIMGGINDFSRGRDIIDTLLSFYESIREKYPRIDLNYPVWGIFSGERIKKGDFYFPDRYYFYNPEGHDKKPAAEYAVGYVRSGYGRNRDVFAHILDYVEKQRYEVCGDAYEEYPLNEICVSDENEYLMRVMVEVRRK